VIKYYSSYPRNQYRRGYTDACDGMKYDFFIFYFPSSENQFNSTSMHTLIHVHLPSPMYFVSFKKKKMHAHTLTHTFYFQYSDFTTFCPHCFVVLYVLCVCIVYCLIIKKLNTISFVTSIISESNSARNLLCLFLRTYSGFL